MTQNFAQYYRSLQILFFSLLGGQVMIILLMLFVVNPPPSELPNRDLIIQMLPVAFIVLAGLAFFLSRKKLERARERTTLEAKLADYRTVSILKWAPIEAGVLISVVMFFISGQTTFLYLALPMLALFATQFPLRQRLLTELDINSAELARMDDPNDQVAIAPKRYNTFLL